MKLVIFDGTFKTTAFINRLIQGLVKQGVEVFVLGFNEEINQKIEGVRYLSLGNSNNRFKFLMTSLNWGFKSNSVFKILKLLINGNKSELKRQSLNAALEQIQPDVVHLQWVSNIKLFEGQLTEKKFKFILSQRGYQTNVRPFVNADNFKYLQYWLPKFDGFHSVSKAISKVGDKIYSDPNKIDQVVYTGLDLDKFEFQPKVVNNATLQLISVGRPHWKKGYDYAIKACSLFHQQGIKFKYTIVGGEGNEELLFLIDDLGLKDKVILTPKLPQTKVFELMKGSDVFVLPSLEEGIANVAVEAMALGTPVVSTNCGGMQELISHGEEGWIVPVRDAEAIVKQILNFIALQGSDIKTLTLAARLKVEEQHNEDKMINDMMDLYKRL